MLCFVRTWRHEEWKLKRPGGAHSCFLPQSELQLSLSPENSSLTRAGYFVGVVFPFLDECSREPLHCADSLLYENNLLWQIFNRLEPSTQKQRGTHSRLTEETQTTIWEPTAEPQNHRTTEPQNTAGIRNCSDLLQLRDWKTVYFTSSSHFMSLQQLPAQTNEAKAEEP